MRTQAHRIVDIDPKRGNVVVRVTGTRHDEPTYQVRQSLPNTQEVPGHDHHTNRVRETGSGSHGPILRSVPTNRLSQHLDRSSGSRHEHQRARELDEQALAMRQRLYPGDHSDIAKDRKSTRLNSSHANISYAVFCLKKKKNEYTS